GGEPWEIGWAIRQASRLHDVFCPLGWITEQKVIVVPEQKGNVPYLGVRLDTLFKKPDAQVRAVGEIAESDSAGIVGVGILRIERGEHIQGVIHPLIFVCTISFFSNDLHQPEPEKISSKVVIAEHGWFQIFALRKLREA